MRTREPEPTDRWKRRLDAFYSWLIRPVHASSLGLFRIVYAYVMMAQILRWMDMFDRFQTSIYALHYPGVTWVRPVSPAMGATMLRVCLLSSVSLGVGFMTRLASVVNYLVFAYLFHICHSFYNNHYVLMCHINFVGCFVNWGAWGSVDALLRKRLKKRTETTVPRWHLWLMQLLFCVPYFWGAVAKMNSDWLFRAQPLIQWFSRREAWIYHQWWFPWFIAWSGMLYDLTISFLLFWKKTRYLLGFPGAIVFNCCNKLMFNIGVFPFAMMASLVLFLDTDHPARIWRAIVMPPEQLMAYRTNGTAPYTPEKDEMKDKRPGSRQIWQRRYVLVFVFGFLLFHGLYPLRHFFLYESTPSWTEEGHTGAWHMKLRSKTGWVHVEFVEKNGTVTKLVPELDPFITRSQLQKVEARPEDMLTYVTRLNQVFEEAGRPLTAIHVHSCFSLNSNPHRQLYVSSANLMDYIGKYEWIGVSGVHKWIYHFRHAPSCERRDPMLSTETASDEAAAAHEELYHQAKIYTGKELNLNRWQSHFVYHLQDVETLEGLEPAYMWNRL